MTLSQIVEQLEATDVSALDAGGVAARLRDLQRLRGFVATTEHALARRANELAASGSGAPAGELLGRVGHTSPRNDATGMYWLRAELDPERGARLFRAIDAETAALAAASDSARTRDPDEPLDRGHVAAVALVELATSANRASRPGKVELLALVDLETLSAGLHDASTCELGDGTTVPVDQGETNLDRLIAACSRHHHLAHEGGWQLELAPGTRELTITLADGSFLGRSRPHSVAAPTVGAAA